VLEISFSVPGSGREWEEHVEALLEDHWQTFFTAEDAEEHSEKHAKLLCHPERSEGSAIDSCRTETAQQIPRFVRDDNCFSSALLTTKFVWPRDEFPARTIMKRHPEERLLAATKDLLFPGLAMSVAERTEQQVL
jgi:hypothetical protein